MKKAQEDKTAKKNAGKGKNSIMNGRALFSYKPDLFVDDEAAVGADELKADEESKVDNALFANEVIDEDVDFDWENNTFLSFFSKYSRFNDKNEQKFN